jgi:hypothetical protein
LNVKRPLYHRGVGSRVDRFACRVIFVALLSFCGRAAAQSDEGFRIDRFRPAPTGEDGIGVQYARTLGHLVPSAGLVIDYAHDPLVVRASDGSIEGEVVAHRVVAHVVAAMGLGDVLELHVRVPVAFSAGDAVSVGSATLQPDVVGIGDGAVGGSVSLFSEGRRGFSLGLVGEALIPWGVATSYASDTDFAARGALLATYSLPAFTVSASAGGIGRFERSISVARSGSELECALGFLVPATPDFDVLVESTLAISLPNGQAHPTPLEAMLGGRYRIGSGFAIEAGVGAGLSLAPGVPDVRALLGIRYTMPPPPITDRDGDGLLDPNDHCPDQAEDHDGWQDEDGCIDPDDDGDGWLDEDDACPHAAEDRDGYADSDGCPDPDDDGDGVPDGEDHCPRAPGESFQNGCPQLITVLPDRITFNWPITFEEGSAIVPVSGGGALDEMARTLAVDETLARWRIAVRIVPVSRRDDGSAIAAARAQALVAALVERGVDASRLEATTLPAGPGDALEFTNLGGTVRPHAPPPHRPDAEVPPPVTP